jgi:hypothetical protein
MAVGGVVDDEVDDDADAAAPRAVQELDEVDGGAVARVDVAPNPIGTPTRRTPIADCR